MKTIYARVVMQAENPDDYIDRVQRAVREQIRQDDIARWTYAAETAALALTIAALGIILLLVFPQ